MGGCKSQLDTCEKLCSDPRKRSASEMNRVRFQDDIGFERDDLDIRVMELRRKLIDDGDACSGSNHLASCVAVLNVDRRLMRHAHPFER